MQAIEGILNSNLARLSILTARLNCHVSSTHDCLA
jgi:hypothetical protein